ncbi:MAG: M3 family oligoendopeptidase [Albidovulum sp.]|nr:M3 family oligoendopeptidase [Albidovulum sp.]
MYESVLPQSSKLEIDLSGASADTIETLPKWDLSDLYESTESEQLARDFAWLEMSCSDFRDKYEGKLESIDDSGLLASIVEYEQIESVIRRIRSFAELRYLQDTSDPERVKFDADCDEKITKLSAALVFFAIELNKIDDARLSALHDKNERLRKYRPFLEKTRNLKPYQLSMELEKFLHDKSVVGKSAWKRLFDETIAILEFEVEGEKKPLESALNMLLDHDRAKRQAAAEEIAKVLGSRITLFSRITSTLIKEKEIEDRWRKLESPQLMRHLHNNVEPEVVDALRQAVVSFYPDLSHRYYEIKAKWLGLDKLKIWDRMAPPPFKSNRKMSWSEAKTTVLDAFEAFSPTMADIARRFFNCNWIDAGVTPGKTAGAFCSSTSVNVHPYILLNYLGSPDDVITLAHELGHGVHQVLAAEQGELLADTPLTLAETASGFGEILTFESLMNATEDQLERKALLAEKVERTIATVVRQIAFYDFECRLHLARRENELTADEIGAIWMEIQQESLGPAFEFMDGYEYYWGYIPHFIHSPFYVYSYAFGDPLVNSMFSLYREEPSGFQEIYFDALRAGGSKHHSELLAPFGIDAADPNFWRNGMSIISGYIDELEAMD